MEWKMATKGPPRKWNVSEVKVKVCILSSRRSNSGIPNSLTIAALRCLEVWIPLKGFRASITVPYVTFRYICSTKDVLVPLIHFHKQLLFTSSKTLALGSNGLCKFNSTTALNEGKLDSDHSKWWLWQWQSEKKLVRSLTNPINRVEVIDLHCLIQKPVIVGGFWRIA